MLNRPRCLHIPYLYEGKGVQLSWAVVDDAAGYRLERKVNGTFEDASLGQTWAQLDKAEEAWDQVEYLGLTWATIEALPAIGLAWENLDAQTLTWDEKEVEGLTWQGFESLPHSNVIYSGSGTAVEKDCGRTWLLLEREKLSWAEIEGRNLTWDDFDQLVEDREHVEANDTIKIGARTALYRISAFNTSGVRSDFFTSDILPIVPVFYRESTLKWRAKKDTRYLVMIEGENLRDIEKVPLTFRYVPRVLELKDFRAQIAEAQIQPTHTSVHLQIDANSRGEVRFRFVPPLQSGESWNGCVTLVELIAKRTGMAEVSLF